MDASNDKGITRNAGQFANVRRLGEPYGQPAADMLGRAYRLLRDSGANSAADRLLFLDNASSDLDFPSLLTLVPSDSALGEVSAKSEKRVHLLRTVRTAVALLSGIFTLFVLAAAGLAYEGFLAAHPLESAKSFLLLWSQRFNGQFALTWADLLIIDTAFLALVLALTFLIYIVERSQLRLKADVSRSLDAAVSQLTLAVARSRVDSPASAEEWAEAARRIIADASEETRLQASTGQQVIRQAETALTAVQEDGRAFISQFSTEVLNTLVQVREDNAQFIARTADEARGTLQPLTAQLPAMLDGLNRELNRMSDVLEQFTGRLPDDNSAEQEASFPPMLVELQRSQAVLLRSQQELHDEVNTLIDRLSSKNASEASAASETDVFAIPQMLVASSPRRPLWQAFTDGLGGVFDLFGGIEHTRPIVPTFEDIAADDAHALSLAMGLVSGEGNGGGEGAEQ